MNSNNVDPPIPRPEDYEFDVPDNLKEIADQQPQPPPDDYPWAEENAPQGQAR